MSERDGARKRRRSSSERTSETYESQIDATAVKTSQNPSNVASGSGTQTGSLDPTRNQTLGTAQTGSKTQESQKISGPASLGQDPDQGFRKSTAPTWPSTRPSQGSGQSKQLQSGHEPEESKTQPTRGQTGQSEIPPGNQVISAGKGSGITKGESQPEGTHLPSYQEPGQSSKVSGGQQTQNPVPGSSVKGSTQRPTGSQNFEDPNGDSKFGRDPADKENPSLKPGASQVTGGSQKPSGGSQVPPGGSQRPSGGSQVPPGGSQVPPGGSQRPPGGSQQPPGGIQEPPGGSQAPPSGGPQQPGGGKGHKVRRKPKRCPVHVEHDILFHCHACSLDICKLCWKLGHTGNSERHHDVVFIEFMKQKEFAERLDKFNLDERLVEIDYQSKLCEKTSTHLKNLIEKLMKERSILKEETEICDTLIMKYGKLQAMARAQNFDHTNKDVVQFMALTDNPYDTREPVMSEEDKEDLEGIIDQLQNLVLERSPESSAAISVMPDQSSFN